MKSKQPHESRKRCGAKKKDGTPCQRSPMPNGRCWLHGGATPSGIASPNFKHGKYSKYATGNLRQKYEEALQDESLLSMKHEVALIDARLQSLLELVDHGDIGARWLELQDLYETLTRATQEHDLGAGASAFEQIGAIINRAASDHETWSEISSAMEQRRKMVDTERKHMLDLQQFITANQAMLLVQTLTSIIREEVTDPDARARIQAKFVRYAIERDGETIGAGNRILAPNTD